MATLLMVEKIENMVVAVTEAIRNLKIDKITVWDSGNNSEGSSATSNFVSSLVQSLPPIHDVAKMSGVELLDYLGSMTEETISHRPANRQTLEQYPHALCMKDNDVVIVGGARTPFCEWLGGKRGDGGQGEDWLR